MSALDNKGEALRFLTTIAQTREAVERVFTQLCRGPAEEAQRMFIELLDDRKAIRTLRSCLTEVSGWPQEEQRRIFPHDRDWAYLDELEALIQAAVPLMRLQYVQGTAARFDETYRYPLEKVPLALGILIKNLCARHGIDPRQLLHVELGN
ncbi:hypothetical protein HY375_03005 [Candidatus Berkelbacteria bacterium]|nr:hypothetical protein [Candidatus Berkelbacteria bacterium]